MKNVHQINERIVLKKNHRVYDEIPLLIRAENAVDETISLLCPPNSERNPSHSKDYTHHILEKGPLYHIIVPRPVAKWQNDGPIVSVSVKAYRAKKAISGVYVGPII